jgi:hypothetical protein
MTTYFDHDEMRVRARAKRIRLARALPALRWLAMRVERVALWCDGWRPNIGLGGEAWYDCHTDRWRERRAAVLAARGRICTNWYSAMTEQHPPRARAQGE